MKHLELPLFPPIYSTYHHQGASSAVLCKNDSIRNWHLNNALNLQCSTFFLTKNYSNLFMTIEKSSFKENPCLDRRWMTAAYSKGYTNFVIKEMLNDGYYVYFSFVDDYYIEGKSFYQQRHFIHDGMICGYDQTDRTFSVYAYDNAWRYRVFKTPQKCFEDARRAAQDNPPNFWGIKAKDTVIKLKPLDVCHTLQRYLKSAALQQPYDREKDVGGIVVHDYIALYLDKLMDGSVPYEKMDWRIFRVLWEQKVFMQERIRKFEKLFRFSDQISEAYQKVAAEANHIHLLYASHHLKRRDNVLPVIKEKLLKLKNEEMILLTSFVKQLEEVLGI